MRRWPVRLLRLVLAGHALAAPCRHVILTEATTLGAQRALTASVTAGGAASARASRTSRDFKPGVPGQGLLAELTGQVPSRLLHNGSPNHPLVSVLGARACVPHSSSTFLTLGRGDSAWNGWGHALGARPPTAVVVVQPCPLLATPWAATRQATLSFTLARSLLKLIHPTISSSVISLSSCPQPFPAPGSFPVSWLFTSDGQSTGTSASASVLPMSIQD